MYYVYVLKSKRNARMYVGRTEDLRRRFQEHRLGKVWTTFRMLPISLLFYEAFSSKADSIRRERYLKTSKGKSTLRMMLSDTMKEYAAMAELGIRG